MQEGPAWTFVACLVNDDDSLFDRRRVEGLDLYWLGFAGDVMVVVVVVVVMVGLGVGNTSNNRDKATRLLGGRNGG